MKNNYKSLSWLLILLELLFGWTVATFYLPSSPDKVEPLKVIEASAVLEEKVK